MNSEIITLSSDEEREDNNPTQPTARNNDLHYFQKIVNSEPSSSGSTKNNYPPYKYHLINNGKDKNKNLYEETMSKTTNSPELVDLVELYPKEMEQSLQNDAVEKEDQNTSECKLVVLSNNHSNGDKLNTDISLQNNETKSNIPDEEKTNVYDEFVFKCVSLEKIEKDKERLMRKLYKYYSNSNPEYVKSEEFSLFVERHMKKLSEQNLYLIAKEVTDELCLQREVETTNSWFGQSKHSSESENNDKNNKLTLRQSKTVNKILWKLSKLQKKIQELEETEVDLSDEEDSVYVRLQNYRNKFCQIYKRLCQYTNQIPDANRMCCRNISFNGSPYLKVNQCIEKWLNSTKMFPDFNDILKLIESQSSTLGLSSNSESVRELAEEIFQKVGAQLKERRKYDLWDSFCGYLKDSEDPAKNNPELEKLLNENFLTRIKKEQEVINHYAEVQEKQKLEPEEISEKEANLSPEDSGNEDENEIEAIESSIDQKLYIDIEKELQNNSIQIDDKEEKIDLVQQAEPLKIRESKNDFKNCKSLKWRQKSSNKSYSEKDETEASNSSANDEENELDSGKSFSDSKSFKSQKNNCNSLINYTINPVIQLKRLPKKVVEAYCTRKEETNNTEKVVNPYFLPSKDEVPAKKTRIETSDLEFNDFDNLKKKKYNLNFLAKYCHIQHNFENILNTLGYFDDFLSDKKNFSSGKVFRDLTNTNKLFNSSGKKKRVGYTSFPTIYKCSINSVQKPLWKKSFKVYNSFSNSNSKEQRCALSHEEKTQTTVKGGGGTNKKDFPNNAGNGEGDNCNFRSDRGSGSERDNNENDENKKNYKTEDDDPDENKYEDEEEKDNDDDEEEEEEESGRFKNNSEEKVSIEENRSMEPSRETLNCERHQKNNEHETEKSESVYNENNAKGLMEEKEENGKGNEKEENAEEKNLNSNEELNCTESSVLEQKSTVDEENGGKIFIDVGKDKKEETQKYDNEISDTGLNDKSNNDNEIMKETIIEKKEDYKTDKNEVDEETQKEKGKNVHEKYEKSENIMIVKEKCEKTDEKTIDVDVKVENESTVQIKKRRRSKFTSNVYPLKGNLRDSSEENKRVTRLTRNKNREKETETKSERIDYNNTGSRNYDALITAEATIGEQVVQAQVTLEEKSSNCHRITNNRRYMKTPGTIFSKKMEVETLRQNLCKRKSTNSTSDEERVKRFLLHSPSSISITPPKKLSLTKPPSQAALQALATLRNLKGISTTRVRTKPKTEDDIVVLGESSRKAATSSAQSTKYSANGVNHPKRKNSSFPVISNVQSMQSVTPKIVGVQGSVGGFENIPQKKLNRNKSRNASPNNSSIKISNVWGALPNSFIQSTPQNEAIPSCSYPQTHPTTSKAANKKNNSKTVEYVELD